jgi:hypothetical protein
MTWTLICSMNAPGSCVIQNVGSPTVSIADSPSSTVAPTATTGEEIVGGSPGGTFSATVPIAGVPVSFWGMVASGSGTVEAMVLVA